MRKILAVISALLLTFSVISPATADWSTGVVNVLSVSAESNSGSYKRSDFRHWIDADRDKCDTRAEVLIAEASVGPRISSPCKVSFGQWFSKYDETTVTNASSLDIDHMIPLKEAWESGASAWGSARLQAFANDLGFEDSLLAVTASTNRSKGDKDPSAWLPPAQGQHCDYAIAWISVKFRWDLSVDTRERDALIRLLDACPAGARINLPQKAGKPGTEMTIEPSPRPSPSAAPSSEPRPTPVPSPTPTQSGSDLFPGVFTLKAQVSDRTQAGATLPVTLTLTDINGKPVPNVMAQYSITNGPGVSVGPSDANGEIKFSIPVAMNAAGSLILLFTSGFGKDLKFVNIDRAASPTPTPSATPTATPTPTPTNGTTSYRQIIPGAFCAREEAGTEGISSAGVIYTCKTSSTENRLRWRR